MNLASNGITVKFLAGFFIETTSAPVVESYIYFYLIVHYISALLVA